MTRELFTRDFKEAVLACLVQEKQFLREAVPVLRSEYLEDSLYSAAIESIFAAFRRDGNPPSRVGLLNDLVNRLVNEYRTQDDKQNQQLVIQPAQDLVDRIFRPIETPRDDIKAKFLSYCRTREMQLTIVDAHNKLETGEIDHESVMTAIRNTYQRSNNIAAVGVDFFNSLELLEQDLSNAKPRAFTTSFASLDRMMDSGGVTPGTMLTFLGQAKGGKSMSLINVGHANCLRGKIVVEFTLELRERQLRNRYASRISNIPMKQMKERSAEVIERCQGFWARHKGRLFLKEYPTGMASTDSFRSYLYWLEGTHGIRPDVLIVDYADLMQPSNHARKSADEERLRQKAAYEDLRALAQEFECAAFTASQTKQESAEKNLVGMTDGAEAYAKVQVSDHIVGFCQTREEKSQNRCRLYYAGTREGESGIIVNCRTNWNVCSVTEVSDRFETQQNEEFVRL